MLVLSRYGLLSNWNLLNGDELLASPLLYLLDSYQMLATTTKFPLLFSAILSITASAATASIPPINARSPQKCNVSYASSILKSLPTGRQFCSSLIYPFGIPTKTKTTTKVVVVTAKECTTKIETKVVHEVFTQT